MIVLKKCCHVFIALYYLMQIIKMHLVLFPVSPITIFIYSSHLISCSLQNDENCNAFNLSNLKYYDICRKVFNYFETE